MSLGAPWQGLGVVVCALTVLAGCGYSVGYRAPPGVRTIAVPIFHNATFGLRREIEYGLTQLVRREIQSRTALRLVDSDRADVVLRGTIVDFREDLVVEGRRDRKVESTIRAVVDVKLEDHVNGYSLTRRVQDQQPFSPAFGETFEETQTRALENLAERIVAAVEYWDDYESAAAPAQPAEG